MPTLYMVRTPGTDEFPNSAHLLEGRVYDNVPREEVDRLVGAAIAEAFDEDEEAHAAAVESFGKLDGRKKEKKDAKEPAKPKAAEPKEPAGYDDWTAEELHTEAGRRNLEGRSALTTKADLVKALEKDDKAAEKDDKAKTKK
jgi:hypothetical protein